MARENDLERLCDVCQHRYGDHYETFDGEVGGCEADDLSREGCPCEGFLNREG
jgi:hypothetical protein